MPPQSYQEGAVDTNDNWMIQEVTALTNRSVLAESICKGNAMGASDGSFCPHIKKGSTAAVVQCQTTCQRVQAVNMVPGHPHDQSSHCSKLAGILAIVKLLQLLRMEHDLTNGSFTFGINNKEACLTVLSQDGPNASKTGCDLILDICK